MTTKAVHGVFLLMLLVPATIGGFVGVFAHLEWLQRVSVVFLLIVGIVAVTDFIRAVVN